MPHIKTPTPVLLILVLAPVALIGATLWVVNGFVPACSISERQRLLAPDGKTDLVTFTRQCDNTLSDSQAILVPSGSPVAIEASGFAAVGGDVDLLARWNIDGSIELTLPENAEVLLQQETIDGRTVVYR